MADKEQGSPHEAPDERTQGVTLSGPLETDDGVCWLAEMPMDAELSAVAETPGRALVRLGRRLDRLLASEGWKARHEPPKAPPAQRVMLPPGQDGDRG